MKLETIKKFEGKKNVIVVLNNGLQLEGDCIKVVCFSLEFYNKDLKTLAVINYDDISAIILNEVKSDGKRE